VTRDLGAPKSAKGSWRPSFQTVQALSVLGLLAAICIVASVRTATFFSWQNLVYNVLTNAAYLGIIACGMTLVMVAGGFDLSVGSTTTVCSVAAVLTLQAMAGQPVWLAIAVAVAVTTATGVMLGAVNGASVAYVGVNPFVTTLSTMLIFRGIALILTHGGQTLSVPLAFKSVVGRIYWGKVSLFGVAEYQVTIPILVFVGVFAVSLYLLHLTRFGHYVYAVGGNENASWLAGINTSLVKAATYAICGLTCAVAAVIYTGMSNTAQASSYGGLELVVIASVIVGGTPLGGGSGGLFFTLIGLLLLSVIENLLPQFGVQEEYRNIVRGLIILIVVAVDVLVRGSGKKVRRT
jgi:ribose/xylose/arabinose/galactoside ABC-type transport system permease subunit